MPDEDKGLVDVWIGKLKNNRSIAVLIVVSVVVGGVNSFYKDLPEGLQNSIGSLWKPAGPPPGNGWAWAGYIDKHNHTVWSQGPFVQVVHRSASTDRPWPIRAGDTVTPTRSIDQVIIDYRDKKDGNVLVPPPHARSVINPAADFTGSKYKPGDKYLVADVVAANFPDSDPVVWLRLIRSD